MYKEIKSKVFTLYIEGEVLSKSLLDYFESSIDELEHFLFSDELQLNSQDILEIECSLSFSDADSMQVLNKNFRKTDKVTDVLSFPVHDTIRENNDEIGQCSHIELGDVIICSDVAEVQAKNFNISYEQEVIHLFIHGLLHLVGFDHEVSEEEEKIMNCHEENLIKKIYLKLGLEHE